DVWAMSDVGVQTNTAKADIPPPRVALRLPQQGMALACNRALPTLQMQQLNRAIRVLRQSGALDRIIPK
ncbi:hypothetical protein, partial [Chromobacterium amazonense]|uniref:hypothetical protein n=1 Tax=Chromobacterium amazonense TaxID=1382803 RepID=UPI003F78E6B0